MTNDELEDYIFDKYKDIESISSIPEPFRTVIAVYSAQGIIGNGGLPYLFECDFPSEDAYEVICQSYRNIGMPEKADALEKVLTLFPNSKPHANPKKRDEFLSKYFDYGNLHPTVDWAEKVMEKGDSYCTAIEYFRKNT